MEVRQTKHYVSQTEDHQWIIEDENSCPLCGTELIFTHEITYEDLKVSEQAHCPHCQIKLKARESSLQ